MSSLIHMAMQRLYFHFQIKYLYLKGSAVYRNENFCPLCHVWAAFAWILTIHKFWPSVYNVCARRAAELRPVHGDLLHRGPAQDPHRRQEAPGQDQVQQREHLQVGEIITQLPMALRPFSFIAGAQCATSPPPTRTGWQCIYRARLTKQLLRRGASVGVITRA